MSSTRQSWPRQTAEKNDVLMRGMRAAFEAGWEAGARAEPEKELCDVLDSVDLWSFDLREEKEKKTAGKRAEKKVTPKKPELSNDLASAEFNPECCKARFWNQKDAGDLSPDQAGHGMQCWRPSSVEGYCMKCLEKKANPDSRTSTSHWFGDFDKPLTESPGEKKDGTPLEDWPALRKLKQKKVKAETKPKKEKKEKKVKKEKKEKKKALKKKKNKPVVEEPVEEQVLVEDQVAEEPVVVEDPVAEEPVVEEKVLVEEPVADENPVDEESTQELSDDDELGEDESPKMEEVDVNGFTLLWNKKTNELIDPDDGEVMGMRVADEEGEWTNKMKEEDESGSESDGSESEDEE